MNFSWASNYDESFNTSNTDFTRVINICKKKIELKFIHINIPIDPTKYIILKYVDH